MLKVEKHFHKWNIRPYTNIERERKMKYKERVEKVRRKEKLYRQKKEKKGERNGFNQINIIYFHSFIPTSLNSTPKPSLVFHVKILTPLF